MSHELPPRFSSGSDESSPGAGDSGKKVEKGTKRKIPKENPKKKGKKTKRDDDDEDEEPEADHDALPGGDDDDEDEGGDGHGLDFGDILKVGDESSKPSKRPASKKGGQKNPKKKPSTKKRDEAPNVTTQIMFWFSIKFNSVFNQVPLMLFGVLALYTIRTCLSTI
jgi:hypothetical protein